MVRYNIGSRAQVIHGKAKQTSGGLRKKDIKYNKRGKIVSKKASKTAKKNNNLVKAGFITKKGVFGVMKKGGSNNNHESIKTLNIYDPRNNKIKNVAYLSKYTADNIMDVYNVNIGSKSYIIGVFYRTFELTPNSRGKGVGTTIIKYLLDNKFDFILVKNVSSDAAFNFWNKFDFIDDSSELFVEICKLIELKKRYSYPYRLIYGKKYNSKVTSINNSEDKPNNKIPWMWNENYYNNKN